MEVYLNRMDGLDDAILTMYYSKRTITRELEKTIRQEVNDASYKEVESMFPFGGLIKEKISESLKDRLTKLFKWTVTHITMGRFLDFSFTVYGMHRAGQDDLDAHTKRFENRIIRSSTRLADYSHGETSEYYENKIVPTDVALTALGITTPNEIEYNGQTYVRAVNGYILKGMENNKDVKRGLYMLSIPSNFIFKCNLTEFAHVYKERNEKGTANPEVKIACETMVNLMEEATAGYVNRELLMKIKN